MVRIINQDGKYLKLPGAIVFVKAIDVLLFDIKWVDYPEWGMLFKSEPLAEEIAQLVSDATGVTCFPVHYRPEEGYFVIWNQSLGVLLKNGGWQYRNADFQQYPGQEFVFDENQFALWWTRQAASDHLHDLLKVPGLREKMQAAKVRPDHDRFRVDHIAEIYGCDPAVWEQMTQTPELPE